MTPLTKLLTKAREKFPGQNITAAHVLVVWAQEDKAFLNSILIQAGIDADQLEKALRPLIERPAEEDAMALGEFIRSATAVPATGWHFLSFLCRRPGYRITRVLVEAGLVLDELLRSLDEHAPRDRLTRILTSAAKAGPLLEFGRDLTEEAATGAFDDLCDRPAQMKALFTILLRKEKRNPVLTGHAGVGKTALVELLARKLVNREVPPRLIGTRVFEISMGKLVAGTKYRGEFEGRFHAVMKALEEAEPAILFIDEFHLVWGAGRAEGAPLDAANMLKPMLDRGRLSVIGATTSEEYHRYIARDPALERRFDELPLEEPSGELLVAMVRKKAAGISQHHKVKIPEPLVLRAIELTDLHLPNLHQPDKSVSLLDRAAAGAVAREEVLQELTEADLLKALEEQTGRPLTKPNDEQRASLLTLGQKLRERIIGQDEAIEKVAATLIFRLQRLGEENRNLASFLFVGSTGVGKTELAKSLAIALFGGLDHLLLLNMEQYQGYDAIQRLLGSSGFHATSEDGVLASWLYARGTGVIVFDEIEKASAQVRNLLLGMLDRGRIRDARGDELDTRQCVIVLTSNALRPGAKGSLGLVKDRKDIVAMLADDFPRELLGRLDEIILFRDLEDAHLREILRKQLREGLERFGREGVAVRYDENQLLEHLLRGLQEAKSTGARGIKRLLERALEQPLAMALAGYSGPKPVTVVLGNEFYLTGRIQIAGTEEGE